MKFEEQPDYAALKELFMNCDLGGGSTLKSMGVKLDAVEKESLEWESDLPEWMAGRQPTGTDEDAVPLDPEVLLSAKRRTTSRLGIFFEPVTNEFWAILC